MSTPNVNISLEPHLLDTLRPVYPLLPRELAHQLEQYISASPPATIPYQTLLGLSQWTTHSRRTEDLKVERFGCAFLLYDRFVGRHDHVTRTQVRVIRAAQGPRRNRGGTRQRTQSYHGITQCSAKYRVCGICSVVGWRKDGLDAGMGTHYITLRTQLG